MPWRDRSSLQDPAWRTFLLRAGAVSLGMHLLCGWLQAGVHHCDEHFQILEYLNVLLGRGDRASLAWEYGKQLRSWVQPVFYWLVVTPWQWLGLENPFIMATGLRLVSALIGFASSMAICLCVPAWFADDGKRRNAVLLSLFFHLTTFIHARTSSENLSQSFWLFAVVLLTLTGDGKRIPSGAAFAAGVLCSVAFFMRFQTGFLVAGTGLWLLCFTQDRLRTLVWLTLGFAAFSVVAVRVDSGMYGRLTVTPYNYFVDQVVNRGAANFGESPWWSYPILWNTELRGIFGPLVVVGSVYAWWKFPRHILTLPSLLFLLGHMLVGHKEARFLFPMLNASLILLGALLPSNFFRWDAPPRMRAISAVVIALNAGFWIRQPFVMRPQQLPVLADLYARAHDGEHIFTLAEDPWGQCNLTMHFYLPPHAVVTQVMSVDEALNGADDRILLHRSIDGAPLEGTFNDPRCTRFSTTAPIYLPRAMADVPHLQDLFPKHTVHEAYECRVR